jgi:hypothetical protein
MAGGECAWPGWRCVGVSVIKGLHGTFGSAHYQVGGVQVSE